MLNHIQILRGIAASLVVIFHTLMYCKKYVGSTYAHEFYALESFGAVGVDIFFVISGFIMVYVSYDKFGLKNAPVDYLIRRIIRIAPIYWIWTIFYVILLLAAPGLFSADKFSVSHTINSLLFIPSINPVTNSATPVVAPGWTLNFEMFFYYAFAVFLLFRRKYLLPGLFVLFTGLAILGYYAQPEHIVLQTYTNTLLLEFLFGCLIGSLYKSSQQFNLYTCYFFIAIGTAWLAASIFYGAPNYLDSDRFLIWGVGASFLVLGFTFIEKIFSFQPKILLAIGDSSYSLYLTHILILPVLAKTWSAMNFNEYASGGFFVLIAFVFAIIFGHATYLLIEKPITNFFNARYQKLKPAVNCC